MHRKLQDLLSFLPHRARDVGKLISCQLCGNCQSISRQSFSSVREETISSYNGFCLTNSRMQDGPTSPTACRSYSRRSNIQIEPKRDPLRSKENRRLDEPEPAYERVSFKEEQFYSHYKPFHCQYGGKLPKLEIAYETWGQLNSRKDNAILVFTGLSGSSHARSHQEVENSQPGWWEKFIGPGGKLDTDKYFVICANHLGGCFGTTGPSSINEATDKPYGGDFPIISVQDMVKAQFLLIDHLKINKLHAVVGSSLGGMACVMAAAIFPDRVKRVRKVRDRPIIPLNEKLQPSCGSELANQKGLISWYCVETPINIITTTRPDMELGKESKMISISACVAANPTSIAFRYIQRLALMSDPSWLRGHYYQSGLPVAGMQLARKIATLTYRSGPEWDERFGRKRIEKDDVRLPRMDGSEFEIEDYIRHQGENFFQKSQYDPNSLLYLSKAMDLFDMSEGFKSIEESMKRIVAPTLVMGASSDILFPVRQQVELAELIRDSGNPNVMLKITEGQYGHDTFLLDLDGMGNQIQEFLDIDSDN